MATWNLLRSARSALKVQYLATRCLPATAWPATPLSQRSGSVARLFSSKPSDDDRLKLAKKREALRVTGDIVNSEAKLLDLFWKWLSHYNPHFDLEDEEAFNYRFGLLKKRARFVNQHNKSGSSFTVGLNFNSDMTLEEFGHRYKCKTYPRPDLSKYLKRYGQLTR
ncbi:hypothetical protein MKW98_007144 [Papaver atlanticum]|uniref:Cathepsin propeptide inhibitor domain-containing protein n=1 Tax=Papaver atlanticum TaxID=357466 RepID=A0AAD4SP37_9MAGN|nr:hypothetical protein MKW98_007144 [Papaver atlanticum]